MKEAELTAGSGPSRRDGFKRRGIILSSGHRSRRSSFSLLSDFVHEKVCLREDTLEIYGISEWSPATRPSLPIFQPHDEERLAVFLCTRACTDIRISCRHVYYATWSPRNTEFDGWRNMCQRGSYPAGFVCGVGKQHASRITER